MSPPTTSDILARIRGIMPDLSATLSYALRLPKPIDPVVADYLRDHLGLWRVRSAAKTDTGPIRAHNEDGFFVCNEDRAFAVFDGMGGSRSGDIATEIALETLTSIFPRGELLGNREHPQPCPMASGLGAVNAAIYLKAEGEPMFRGIGAAGAGIFVDGWSVCVAHVGDSRVYRHRMGQLDALTEDHSLLNEMLRIGKLNPEDAEDFPYKNVITRALGMTDTVDVDHAVHPAEPGDRFIVCTDGLHKAISDEDLCALMDEVSGEPVEEVAEHLVQAAIDAETNDNIAVVVVEVG